jgi:hypothetical protein
LVATLAADGVGFGDIGAKGVERVVGDETAPDEGPKRVNGFAGIAAAGSLMERVEEAGSGGFEDGEELFFALGERLGDGAALGQERKTVGEEESYAAVALAHWLDAGPGDLAGGEESVQAGG